MHIACSWERYEYFLQSAQAICGRAHQLSLATLMISLVHGADFLTNVCY